MCQALYIIPFHHQNSLVRHALLLFPFSKWGDRSEDIKWFISVNRRVEFKSILNKGINSLKLSQDLGLAKNSDHIWNGRWRKVHRFKSTSVLAIEKWCQETAEVRALKILIKSQSVVWLLWWVMQTVIAEIFCNLSGDKEEKKMTSGRPWWYSIKCPDPRVGLLVQPLFANAFKVFISPLWNHLNYKKKMYYPPYIFLGETKCIQSMDTRHRSWTNR